MKFTILSVLCLISSSIIAQSDFIRIYDQLTDNTSIAYSIKPTSDGGFITIGSTNEEKDPDIFIIKNASDGSAMWARQCSGAELSADVALDIVPTADGGYLFAGNSDNQRVIWKVDSIGNDLWKRPFGENGNAAFATLIATRDGGYIAVGDGMVMTKIDADGKELWTRNKPTEHVSAYKAIREMPNGDLLIGGYFTARDQGRAIAVLVRTDANGKGLWAETYGPGMINAIDVDEDGNIWVAGNASYAVPVVIKISSEGKAIWEGMYEEDRLGSAHSISAGKEKTVVFTAAGYFTVNSDGEQTHRETTANFGFNKGFVASDGDLVMAGFSDQSVAGKEKFTILKMDKAGFPSPTASTQ